MSMLRPIRDWEDDMRGFWIAGIVSTFMLGACTTGPMPDGESVSTSVPISEESAFAADFGMLADLVGTRWYGEPSQADADRSAGRCQGAT